MILTSTAVSPFCQFASFQSFILGNCSECNFLHSVNQFGKRRFLTVLFLKSFQSLSNLVHFYLWTLKVLWAFLNIWDPTCFVITVLLRSVYFWLTFSNPRTAYSHTWWPIPTFRRVIFCLVLKATFLFASSFKCHQDFLSDQKKVDLMFRNKIPRLVLLLITRIF